MKNLQTIFDKKQDSPFIILEAGINHNGSIEKCFKLIDAAKDVGAHAIKFQTYKAEELILDKSLQFSYHSQGAAVTESMQEMFKRFELTSEEWFKIKTYCDQVGINFFSSPQNYSDAKFLEKLGVDGFKIGSDDFVNHLLLDQISTLKKPMILSIGMCEEQEIHDTMALLSGKNIDVALMVCTSEYPAKEASLNLRRVQALKKQYKDINVGFSDHSVNSVGAIAAMALGATFFEKHFTLDKSLPGPDHWFSEDTESAKKWIDDINSCFSALGSGQFEPSKHEMNMRFLARRSLHLGDTSLKKGAVLTKDSLVSFRPGDGILGSQYKSILGKVATRDISAYQKLNFDDFK